MSSHDAVPREGATAASVTRKTPGKKGAPEPAPLGAVVGEHWRARSVLRTLPDDQNTGLWRTLNQVYAELPGQRPEEISGQLRTIVLPSYQTWCTARRAAQRFGAPLASPIARNPPPTPSPPKLMCVAQLDNCALTSAVLAVALYYNFPTFDSESRSRIYMAVFRTDGVCTYYAHIMHIFVYCISHNILMKCPQMSKGFYKNKP